uniref:BZIP domain-containing protein n=1 Tax=Panagrolaimus sp. ES5 TaxID=591445 RepID=A0AC34G8P0_9BILA
MSIRFLTKQEPSPFTDSPEKTPPSSTANPWIRLDVKQEISEFSYIPVEQREDSRPSVPTFQQQRPSRKRISRPSLPPPPPTIKSFEDALEAIRTGLMPSVEPIRRPKQRIMPSSSSRSPSHSDNLSRSSSVELGSGKKYSLMGLSNNEVKERKKVQNILAARRYRQRRNELINERREEIQKLEDRKAELKLEEASLAGQIQALKDLFSEQLKQRVGATTVVVVAAANDTKLEIQKLEDRKAELKLEEASLAGQIQALKDLFSEQLKQRVGATTVVVVAAAANDTKLETPEQQTKQCAAVQASVDDIEANMDTVEADTKDTVQEQTRESDAVENAESDMITVEPNDEITIEKSEPSNAVVAEEIKA